MYNERDSAKTSARIFIECLSLERILEAENKGTSPDKLATKLMMCIFTKEEVQTAIAHPPEKKVSNSSTRKGLWG